MAASTVIVFEIATLNHEIIDDSVKDNAVIPTLIDIDAETLSMHWSVTII